MGDRLPRQSLHTMCFAAAGLQTTWGITRLRVPPLWWQGLSGRGVRVAHLDTGVSTRHRALSKALAAFAEFDLDGQPVAGARSPHDSGEHGTHTAGTIAARASHGKAVGVAPGAELASAIVIEGGNVAARLRSGIDWAIRMKSKVISMSVGLRDWTDALVPVIRLARKNGMLVVAAVGDEGPDASLSPGNYENVLSVGACDQENLVPWFSSSESFDRPRNPTVPTVLAPGTQVISTAPSGGYQAMAGSSMAAAHIAGLAALLWEARPHASEEEIENAIVQSSTLPKSVPSQRGNFGIPDAVIALKLLTGINCDA